MIKEQQLYKHITTYINNTIATGFTKNKPPERPFAVTLDTTFDTINIHTYTTPNKHHTHHYQIHRKLHQMTQMIHYIQKKYQHNAQSKLVFHKAASYHPHYSTYTHIAISPCLVLHFNLVSKKVFLLQCTHSLLGIVDYYN